MSLQVATAKADTSNLANKSLSNLTSPTAVNQDIIMTSSKRVQLTAGTTLLPSLTFASDLNTGIYSDSADYLPFACGGTLVGYFAFDGASNHFYLNPSTSTFRTISTQHTNSNTGNQYDINFSTTFTGNTGAHYTLNVTNQATSTNTQSGGISASAAGTNTSGSGLGLYYNANGNIGVYSGASCSTADGISVGVLGAGDSSKRVIGIHGLGVNPTNVAGNQAYGVRGFATQQNSAQSVGLYAGIATTFSAANEGVDPGASAAIIANNGDTTSDIFRAHDNNTAVFRIKDGGDLCTNQTAAATTLGAVAAKMPIYNASGTLVGYIPVYDNIT